jgi:threonine aldolase
MATIDLRSDTVTLPSPAMRAAINEAPLGDDVYGEDPTVNRLEELAAEIVGKEAALLVSSGTMGNLAALLSHCRRGESVLLGDESHIYVYEAGGASVLGGLPYRPLPTLRDGTLEGAALEAALATEEGNPHFALPGVVCLENTHNRCGGVVLRPEYMAHVHALAAARGLPVHLDGARVFNAAVSLGVDVRELTRHVDSVQFCLSKGLAAPVGSVLAGPRPFIERARRVRKMLGGGMRQAGIIAAAGIVALTEMVGRLADDHANARMLAEGLAALPGVQLDLARVQSNIVIFAMPSAEAARGLIAGMAERGVLLSSMGGPLVRAVTHYGITADDIQHALTAAGEVVTR